jgi:hypothetical protein
MDNYFYFVTGKTQNKINNISTSPAIRPAHLFFCSASSALHSIRHDPAKQHRLWARNKYNSKETLTVGRRHSVGIRPDMAAR